MTSIPRTALLATAIVAAGLASPASTAAESYDSCTGFIESLPATISTQGVWCLRRNLATAMTSGNAITITVNNVTIDCNDFKIGGLAAGDESKTVGIAADDVLNATVRQCAIRGFFHGIRLTGAGHLIEDNRLDGNLYIGIEMEGDDHLVRRNRVFETGGSAFAAEAFGIAGETDVVDNVVAGVQGVPAAGVFVLGGDRLVSGNRVSRILATELTTYGLAGVGEGVVMRGNYASAAFIGTYGITTGPDGMCESNQVSGFTYAYEGCAQANGNLSVP